MLQGFSSATAGHRGKALQETRRAGRASGIIKEAAWCAGDCSFLLISAMSLSLSCRRVGAHSLTIQIPQTLSSTFLRREEPINFSFTETVHDKQVMKNTIHKDGAN